MNGGTYILKKVLAATCALAMLAGTATALPRGAFDLGAVIGTSAATYGDYEYEVLDDGTVEISKYYGEDAEIVIPSEIDVKKVTSIGSEAFNELSFIESVTIPDSVTSIGDCAFYNCESLENIDIPASVTSISFEAFADTPWMDAQRKLDPLVIVNNILIDGQICEGDVEIPDSVTSIGDDVFTGCSSSLRIFCFKNSAAHQCAKDNGFVCIFLDPVDKGDVNGDGNIDMLDLVALQRKINGWKD